MAAPDIFIWGPLEEPVLQQGELSTVCVGLSERDLIISMQWHDVTRKILGGRTGGARHNFLGEVAPLAPPSSAPVEGP